MAKFLGLALILGLTALTSVARANEQTLSYFSGVPGQKVFFASDLGQWDATRYPMPEVEPGKYEFKFAEPWLPFIRYKFVVDGHWETDPNNPQQQKDGLGGYNSVWAFPDFQEDPLLDRQLGVIPHLQKTVVVKDWEGTKRNLTVLLPAVKRTMIKPRFYAYFQDGGDYLEKGAIANLVANLSNQPDMPAIVAILIPPKDRNREYALNEDYVRFVATSLVPEVEQKLGASVGRNQRVIVGPSLGGLISFFTAVKYPEVFGNVVSQSGSFWWDEGRMVNLLAGMNTVTLFRAFNSVGSYETLPMNEFNEKVAQESVRIGIQMTFRKVPALHNWMMWRNELSGVLRRVMAIPQDQY
ncbi:alpha/beta hydrolase-fold protein [Bdellovibrionota bacterium FG-2]